jgi:hypothetical protein
MKKNHKIANKFFKKQVSKLTVGETCKFAGIMTVISIVLAIIPLGIIWICEKIGNVLANRKHKTVAE